MAPPSLAVFKKNCALFPILETDLPFPLRKAPPDPSALFEINFALSPIVTPLQ